MSMIERVARAMCRDARRQRNEVLKAMGKADLAQPEEASEEHSWPLFRDQARAAIEAMRDAATLEMENAAVGKVRPYHDEEWHRIMPKDLFRIAWPAMIDAAIKENA